MAFRESRAPVRHGQGKRAGVKGWWSGPDRLCDWCGELAFDCACKGPLTLNEAALSFNRTTAQEGPRAERTTSKMSPALKHVAFGHYAVDLTPRDYPKSRAILQRLFHCPHCERMMPAHVCSFVKQGALG